MKISAFFNNIDEAETAVRAIRDNGIVVKSRRKNNVDSRGMNGSIYFPLYPEGESFGMINNLGLYGTNDYSYSRGAIYLAPFELGQQVYREHVTKEVQIILEVSEADGKKAADILVNRHGMNVRRF